MFAVTVRAVAAAAALASAAAAHAGTVELTINPSTVAAGDTLTVTGSVTNTSRKSASFTADYSVTGPCSYSDTYSVSFKLGSRQTRTASVNYTAPSCAGMYTVFVTLTGDGSTASATASFTVE